MKMLVILSFAEIVYFLQRFDAVGMLDRKYTAGL